jgi:hypothetical protein
MNEYVLISKVKDTSQYARIPGDLIWFVENIEGNTPEHAIELYLGRKAMPKGTEIIVGITKEKTDGMTNARRVSLYTEKIVRDFELVESEAGLS